MPDAFVPNDIELAQVRTLCAKFAAASDGYEYAVGLTALEFYVATILHMTEVSIDDFMAGVRRSVERMQHVTGTEREGNR